MKTKTIQLILPLLFIFSMLFALTGCQSDGENGMTSETGYMNADTADKYRDFKMESVEIAFIGTGKEKYTIDEAEADLSTEEKKESFYAMLDGLEKIGNASLDSKNIDNPITLTIGQYYNFLTHFITPNVYEGGLKFSFLLVADDNSTTELFQKQIDSGISEETNETGEQELSIDTLIPSDLKEGRYIFMVLLLDADMDNLVKEGKEINSTSEIGSFYVNLKDSDSKKRVEIVDTVGSPYIDLDINEIFENGYAKQQAQKADFYIYNSSYLSLIHI